MNKKVREKDRKKINKYQENIKSTYLTLFEKSLFCNRCLNCFQINNLEIAHYNYSNERFAELVCRTCHEKIDFTKQLLNLSELIKTDSFNEIAILIFNNNTSLFGLMKLEQNGKWGLKLIGKIQSKQEMKLTFDLQKLTAKTT